MLPGGEAFVALVLVVVEHCLPVGRQRPRGGDPLTGGADTITRVFTIADVDEVHDRLGAADTLPEYLRELNAIGVAKADSFPSDGHSEYIGEDGYKVVGSATHETLAVAEVASPDQLRHHLQRHNRGETSYVEMSKGLAASGIAKWTFDTKRMTISYWDSAGDDVLVEDIR